MAVNEQLLNRQWIRLLHGHERRVFKQVASVLNRYLVLVSKDFERLGMASLDLHLPKHKKEMERLLEALYKRVIPDFTGFGLEEKRYNISLEYKIGLFETLIGFWISRNALDQATLISETSRDKIVDLLSITASEGLGASAIASRIRDIASLTPSRAKTIAITEVHNSASFASFESTKQFMNDFDVVMLKKWSPVVDERTRINHAEMSRVEPISIDKKFIVGGKEMVRPADPNGGAENVIRCRCALLFAESKEEFV